MHAAAATHLSFFSMLFGVVVIVLEGIVGILGRLQWELGKECAWALLVFYIAASKDDTGACFVLCSLPCN